MLLNKIIYVFVLVVFIQSLSAQSVNKLIKLGENEYNNKNYYGAIYFYKKSIDKNLNQNTAYHLALAYYKYRDYNNANRWFKYSIDNNFKNDKIYFYYGLSLKSSGKYQLAIINFKKYAANHSKDKDYFSLKSNHEIFSCEKALYLSFKPDTIKIYHLDTIINKIFSEYQTYEFADSVLFLSSLRPFYDSLKLSKIYTSKIIDKKYNILKYFDIVKDSSNVTNFTFDKKANILYFTKCDYKNNNCKICRINLNDANKSIEVLPKQINKKKCINTQPNIAYYKNKKYLLWVSDRSGGYGKLDIWYSEIDTLNNLGDAKNIGNKINSIDNEITPFYSEDEKTLYFSSQWFDNVGGFDVFKSEGNFNYWSQPENLGFPINSNNNDLYFSINSNHTKALFASNREEAYSAEGELCCNDIFYYKLKEIKNDSLLAVKKIKKQIVKTEQLIPITLYFDNDKPNPKTLDTITNLNYEQTYNAYIELVEKYKQEFSKGLKKENIEKSNTEIEDFFYNKVQKEFFKLKSFISLMESLLEKNQKIEITIKGFASPLNDDVYNEKLSKRRINSLENYLYQVDNGFLNKYIKKGNLTIKREAYGESTASQNISDNLNDLRNSVYSVDAAKERKIKIIAVKFQ